MTSTSRKPLRMLGMAAAIVAGAGGLFVGEEPTAFAPFSLVSQAEARVGRPLTPVSYAGVARRTTRRAVVGTAAVAGTAYAVAPRAGCIEAIDAYGRTYWRCP
jgi:hypothetical protein